MTAEASSVTFRLGLGLGASAGAEVHYCAECNIRDVSSGDSFTAEVDALVFGGELLKVEDADSDEPFVRGEGRLSGGGSPLTGLGAGFFFSLDTTAQQALVDHVTGEASVTPSLPDVTTLPQSSQESGQNTEIRLSTCTASRISSDC